MNYKEDEFNLSKKMFNIKNQCFSEMNVWMLDKEDVKEFVKRLKEFINKDGEWPDWPINDFINKLAGEKLI